MHVTAREGETFEELFRRFKRGVEAAGILRDFRRQQRFKPAHEERRDKIRAAQRKRRRAKARQ
ncbi:MAG: 30S ribosomal protein S21 [Chloroflexota bacterium]